MQATCVWFCLVDGMSIGHVGSAELEGARTAARMELGMQLTSIAKRAAHLQWYADRRSPMRRAEAMIEWLAPLLQTAR